MARSEEREDREASAAGAVVLLVCLECGREVQLEGDEAAPEGLKCEKCGNEVFRRFDDTDAPDDVQADFRETTEREVATDDPPGDVVPGDLHDLNNA